MTEGLRRAAVDRVERIKAGLVNVKAERYAAEARRPLAEHLAEYRTHLGAQGAGEKHADTKINRARRVLSLAGAAKIGDLTPARITAALGTLRAGGLNQQTLNHYVQAVKGLARWLWRDGRCREHALADLSTASAEGDRRRVRRALTPDEAVKLLRAASEGPKVRNLHGTDRAVLYGLALGTGLRSDELRTLTPERFHLDGDPPTVTVKACYAKNGKEAVQPLPPALETWLRPWLETRIPDYPVFGDLTVHTAKMLRVDLAAAGIPVQTSEGVVDFHSLRTTYITHVANSGASIKTTQTLARHSTPTLTFAVYARTTGREVSEAAAMLPESWRITDGEPIRNHRALPQPYGEGVLGRSVAVPGGLGSGVAPGAGEFVNPMAVRSFAGGMAGAVGEAPGGFEPPMEVLQTSALPLGYGARS